MRPGPLLAIALPIANVVAWVLFPPADDGRSAFMRQILAEMVSSTAVILFAAALLLSTRARLLEPMFGGLDKMYRTHREVSVAGFLLLILHVVLVPWRLEPGGGVPAGLLAFGGFVVLVVLTIGPRLPVTRRWVTMGYRTWKRTHRLIGVFFVFACAHTFLVRPLLVDTVIPFGLVLAAYGVGIASYLYDLFLARFVRPSRRYSVAEAKRLNDTTVEVVLLPRKKPLDHEAGQFVFVSFSGRRLRESHPFTVASSPRDGSLRLVIKASGDFTRRLHERLETGTKARVEGSYGMLDHRRGGPRQIWIAGGIGITPFLSWLRDLEDLHGEVDLFYAVHDPDQALFADEIEELAASHDDVRFHLNISERDGSLSIEAIESVAGDLADLTVYMCGPVPMIEAFEGAFVERGVHRRDIHYEEFAFR